MFTFTGRIYPCTKQAFFNNSLSAGTEHTKKDTAIPPILTGISYRRILKKGRSYHTLRNPIFQNRKWRLYVSAKYLILYFYYIILKVFFLFRYDIKHCSYQCDDKFRQWVSAPYARHFQERGKQERYWNKDEKAP